MLTLSDKIKSDLASKITTIQPIILFNAKENMNTELGYGPTIGYTDDDANELVSESFFISNSQRSIKATADVLKNGVLEQEEIEFVCKPLLKNLPGTKESLDWQKKRFKIGSCNLSLDNGIHNGSRISDTLLHTGLNKVVVLFWATQSVDNLTEAREIFYGKIKNIKHDDRTCTVELEDNSSNTIHTPIPRQVVPKSETTPERSWFKPYPMVYGRVFQSPILQLNSHIIEDAVYNPQGGVSSYSFSSIDVEYAIDSKPIFGTYSMPNMAYITRNPYGPLWHYADPHWYKLPETVKATDRFNEIEGMSTQPIEANQKQYFFDLDNSKVIFERKKSSFFPLNLCGGGYFEIEAVRLCQESIGWQNGFPNASFTAHHTNLSALISTNPNTFYTLGQEWTDNDGDGTALPSFYFVALKGCMYAVNLQLDLLGDSLEANLAMSWVIEKTNFRNYTDTEAEATPHIIGCNTAQGDNTGYYLDFYLNYPSWEEADDSLRWRIYNGSGDYSKDTFTTTAELLPENLANGWVKAGGNTKFAVDLDLMHGTSSGASSNFNQSLNPVTVAHVFIYNMGYVQRILVDNMFNKDIYCSVLGRIDDDGTFLENPAYVVKHIVEKEIGAASQFDSQSVVDAVVEHGSEALIHSPWLILFAYDTNPDGSYEFGNILPEASLDGLYTVPLGPTQDLVPDSGTAGPYYLMIPIIYTDVIHDADVKRLPRYKYVHYDSSTHEFNLDNILDGKWIDINNFLNIDFSDVQNSAEHHLFIKDEIGNRIRYTHTSGWEALDGDFICESGHTYQFYMFHNKITSSYVEDREDSYFGDVITEGIKYDDTIVPTYSNTPDGSNTNWKMMTFESNIFYDTVNGVQPVEFTWCHPALFTIPGFLDVCNGFGVPDYNQDGYVNEIDVLYHVNRPEYYKQALELSRTTNMQGKYFHHITSDDDSYMNGRFDYVSVEPSIKLAFSLHERVDSQDFIEDVLTNTKSALILRNNNARFITQKDEYTMDEILDEDGNFDNTRVIHHNDVGNIKYQRTALKDIITNLNVEFNYDIAAGKFRESTGFGVITDERLLGTSYSHDYYNLRLTNFDFSEDYPDSTEEFKAYYIQDLASALLLRDYMLMKYCNQRLQLEFEVPTIYMALEPGDIISFDSLVGGMKAFGIDYTKSTYVNGQVQYPLFMITEIKKKQEKIEIKAEQLQRLKRGLQPDISSSITYATPFNPQLPISDGDINLDGIVNVIDIVNLVNGVLGVGGATITDNMDINDDGIANVVDIVQLVNMILLDYEDTEDLDSGPDIGYAFSEDITVLDNVVKFKAYFQSDPSFGDTVVGNATFPAPAIENLDLYRQCFIQNYGIISPHFNYTGDDTSLGSFSSGLAQDIAVPPNYYDEYIHRSWDVNDIYGDSVYISPTFPAVAGSYIVPFLAPNRNYIPGINLYTDVEWDAFLNDVSFGINKVTGVTKDILFWFIVTQSGYDLGSDNSDLKNAIYNKLDNINTISDVGTNWAPNTSIGSDLPGGEGSDTPLPMRQFTRQCFKLLFNLNPPNLVFEEFTADGKNMKAYVEGSFNPASVSEGLHQFLNDPALSDNLQYNDLLNWLPGESTMADNLNIPFYYFFGLPSTVDASNLGFLESTGINVNSMQNIEVSSVNYEHKCMLNIHYQWWTDANITVPLGGYILDIEYSGQNHNNIKEYIDGES
tara:strand:- start:2306 stop:7345 length:5040 start_codon:yes stop_codon:yes gene_type:complete